MTGLFRRKLSVRLLASVLAIATLVLLVFGIVSYLTTRSAMVEQAQAQAQTIALRAELAIGEPFEQFALVPDMIAMGEQAQQGDRLAHLRIALPPILERLPTARNVYVFYEPQVIRGHDYAALWYTRENGLIKAYPMNFPLDPSYDPQKPLYEYHIEGWYQQANGASGTVWSDPYIDPTSKVALLSGTGPIMIDGEFKGVAGIDMDIDGAMQLVQNIRPSERGYAFLLDRNGVFIANPRLPNSAMTLSIDDWAESAGNPELAQLGDVMLRGEHGLREIIDPSTGELSWVSYAPVASTGWSVAVMIPQADLLAGAEQLKGRMLLMGLGSLALLAALVTLMALSISSPLTRLTGTSQALAQGDLAARSKIERSDEIGVLSSSFNTMADALQARIIAEQQAQAEAERLRRAEEEDRERLERTVADYLHFVQQIARGDLNARLSISQNGALGQLGSGLNHMAQGLHALTRQVQQAANNIAGMTTEILAATTQQAASAAEQSAAISQATTTIEEVKVIAQQTAAQAAQLAQESQAALAAASTGTHAVEETVEGMSQIRVRVEHIAQTILSLAEQTQAISTIILTVNEIADQSNLLALNAAIEAARAGEHGKSFAVVAHHVRDLAERSKAATGQVSDILGEIQRSTNTAVLVTEEGSKGVEVGARLAGQAGQIIHRIAAEVESGAQANVQMAAASHQQTTGMEQIGQAMQSIQQATTQALASTRQAERAARDLNALAQQLQSSISAYQL